MPQTTGAVLGIKGYHPTQPNRHRVFDMQWLRRISLAGLACASLAGAAPHVDFDPTVDFTAWKTFAVELAPPAAAPADPMDNELFQKRLTAAVIAALGDHGMTLGADAPQFKVRATLIAKPGAKRKSSFSIGLGGGSYGGSGGVSVGGSKTMGGDLTTEYSISIEMRDATTGELAWQGWREVPEKVGDSGSSALDKSVRDILKPFPPKPKKKKK